MTVEARKPIHASLAEAEAAIRKSPHGPLSLDPNRQLATSIGTLVTQLADARQVAHLSTAASAVAEAQLQSFPENLFWDFDFFLASIHRNAAASSDYAEHIGLVTQMTVELMRLYGQESVIRFRYAHDFMYGFDWARWVRRSPDTRHAIEPFGLEFLKHTARRGREIFALIESDDAWYPSLARGVSRNPFPFSREPQHELALYRRLAECREIPVEAWRVDAQPDASRDFDQLRAHAARILGLVR